MALVKHVVQPSMDSLLWQDHLYLSMLCYILLLSFGMGRGQRMSLVLPKYPNHERTEATEYSKRPLSFPFHTHTHTHTQTTHTHTHCKDKAEAAMLQHASFTLHLLWSTKKTQSVVCVTQYGPLSISSLLPLFLSFDRPCLSYIAIVQWFPLRDPFSIIE